MLRRIMGVNGLIIFFFFSFAMFTIYLVVEFCNLAPDFQNLSILPACQAGMSLLFSNTSVLCVNSLNGIKTHPDTVACSRTNGRSTVLSILISAFLTLNRP